MTRGASTGTWFVANEFAIWHTTETGPNELVARLPWGTVPYSASLARAPDGTFYIGGQSGRVLRLTPMWSEAPRFAADFLVPTGSPQQLCSRRTSTLPPALPQRE